MSSRTYHYRKAEELLAQARGDLSNGVGFAYSLAAAQVHATLATVSTGVEEHASAIERLGAERAELEGQS